MKLGIKYDSLLSGDIKLNDVNTPYIEDKQLGVFTRFNCSIEKIDTHGKYVIDSYGGRQSARLGGDDRYSAGRIQSTGSVGSIKKFWQRARNCRRCRGESRPVITLPAIRRR